MILEGWDTLREMFKDFEEKAHYDIQILIAINQQVSYEGSAYVLFQDLATNKLFEVHGSHCSCNGFEGQWAPEEVSIEYLDKIISDGTYHSGPFNSHIVEIRKWFEEYKKELEEMKRIKLSQHNPPQDSTMGEAHNALWTKLDEEEFVNRVAKECVKFINGKGGIGCTNAGIARVAKRLLEIL